MVILQVAAKANHITRPRSLRPATVLRLNPIQLTRLQLRAVVATVLIPVASAGSRDATPNVLLVIVLVENLSSVHAAPIFHVGHAGPQRAIGLTRPLTATPIVELARPKWSPTMDVTAVGASQVTGMSEISVPTTWKA